MVTLSLKGQRALAIKSVVGAVAANLGFGAATRLEAREFLSEEALLIGTFPCLPKVWVSQASEKATCVSCLLEQVESPTRSVFIETAQGLCVAHYELV